MNGVSGDLSWECDDIDLQFEELLEAELTLKFREHVGNARFHVINFDEMYEEAVRTVSTNKLWNGHNAPSELSLSKRTTSEKSLKIFRELQKSLKKYTLEMNKRFQCYYILSDEKLTEFHNKACKQISTAASNHDDDLISFATSQYIKMYTERNDEIINSEKELLKTVTFPILFEWYSQETKQEQLTARLSVEGKHNLLKQQCVNSIKTSFSYNDTHTEIMKDIFDCLDYELNKLHIQIEEQKMRVAKQNDGENIRSTGKIVNRPQENLKQSLKKESNTAHQQPPPPINVNKKTTEIEPSAPSIQNDTLRIISTAPATEPKTVTGHNSSKKLMLVTKNQITKLAVEFGQSSSQCGVILNGELKIIPTESSEEKFSNVVEFNEDDQIIVDGKLKQNHRMTFHFVGGAEEPSKNGIPTRNISKVEIKIKGQMMEVRKELLCARILLKMKLAAESHFQQQNGIKHVVITVPLWYSMVERQSMKDAATIAGFTRADLINETSAVAVACFRNAQPPTGGDLLVIVEKGGHFDEALYRIPSDTIEMENCSVDFPCNGDCTPYIKKRYGEGVPNVIYVCPDQESRTRATAQSLRSKPMKNINNPILLGAALYEQQEDSKEIIRDLLPRLLKIKLKKNKKILQILPKNTVCNNRILNVESRKNRNIQNCRLYVNEYASAKKKGRVVGRFEARDIVALRDISITLDHNGIVFLNHKDNHLYNFLNLHPKEMALWTDYVKVQDYRKNILQLTNLLSQNIAQSTSSIIREEIGNEMRAAQHCLNNKDTSVEVLEAKLWLLQQLKLKYANKTPSS